VGPRAGLNAVEKSLLPLPGIEPRLPRTYPIAIPTELHRLHVLLEARCAIETKALMSSVESKEVLFSAHTALILVRRWETYIQRSVFPESPSTRCDVYVYIRPRDVYSCPSA
jgi:hypothetical protein